MEYVSYVDEKIPSVKLLNVVVHVLVIVDVSQLALEFSISPIKIIQNPPKQWGKEHCHKHHLQAMTTTTFSLIFPV